MSSRLLAVAKVAAAKFVGNSRTVGNLPVRAVSLDEVMATLKREIKHPEARPEHEGQFLYRNIVPQFSLVYRMKYTLLMATFWYWLMFHFYFEHEHAHVPDPSKWTDEELGIPLLEDD